MNIITVQVITRTIISFMLFILPACRAIYPMWVYGIHVEAGSEPSESAELPSSGPRSAMNPAAPRQLPSAVPRTTGPAVEYTLTLGTRNVETHPHTNTRFKEQRYGKHTPIHSYTLTLQFAWTLSCLQKNLTTNFITCSAWQDIKSLPWIIFKCFFPPHLHIRLLISTCSKASTPLKSPPTLRGYAM